MTTGRINQVAIVRVYPGRRPGRPETLMIQRFSPTQIFPNRRSRIVFTRRNLRTVRLVTSRVELRQSLFRNHNQRTPSQNLILDARGPLSREITNAPLQNRSRRRPRLPRPVALDHSRFYIIEMGELDKPYALFRCIDLPLPFRQNPGVLLSNSYLPHARTLKFYGELLSN